MGRWGTFLIMNNLKLVELFAGGRCVGKPNVAKDLNNNFFG